MPSLAACALAGCAHAPIAPIAPSEERNWVLSGAGHLGTRGEPAVDAADIMQLDDEMRAFARAAVAHSRDPAAQVHDLSHALDDAQGLNLRYDAQATLTVREAFHQRRVNCISHTLLFIALAREVGIPARFNQVEIPPLWDLRDDSLVLYQHVNARVEIGQDGYNANEVYRRVLGRFQVVDLALDEYEPNYPQWTLSDEQAQAQFYNNRSVELRGERRFEPALRYQLRSLQLDPDRGYLWANLAHLYLAMGDTRAAEIAVCAALQADPDGLAAYGTAARIYRALGDDARADQLALHARSVMRRNPYYHYRLAQRALERNQLDNALDESERAIGLGAEDHRVYFLRAVILARLNRPEQARQSIETAINLASDETQQTRYRSKLARLAAPHG